MGFLRRPCARPELLDVYAAAAVAGTSPKALREWVASGRLGTIVIGGRQLVDQATLARFLRARDGRDRRVERTKTTNADTVAQANQNDISTRLTYLLRKFPQIGEVIYSDVLELFGRLLSAIDIPKHSSRVEASADIGNGIQNRHPGTATPWMAGRIIA